MLYNKVFERVKYLLDEKRFNHSLNVEKEAIKLAERFNLDIEKIRIAAIAHDLAKKFDEKTILNYAKEYGIIIDEIQKKAPDLLHGPVAAFYLKNELQLEDEDIFNSIYYHTTGRPNMTLFEQVIYIADMISEDREYPGLDKIRELLTVDFKKALIFSTNRTLIYVIERNFLIHPLTIDFRNWLLTKGGN